MKKHYLLASDFDQTLSFNDSGIILSEVLGVPGFREKVAGLSRLNLVQQGAELAYLLRHDPEYRAVTHVAYLFQPEYGPPPADAPLPQPGQRPARGPVIGAWFFAISH